MGPIPQSTIDHICSHVPGLPLQADTRHPGPWTGSWQSSPCSGKACDSPLVNATILVGHIYASVNVGNLALPSSSGDSLPMCKCWLETCAGGRGHPPLPGYVIQRHLRSHRLAPGTQRSPFHITLLQLSSQARVAVLRSLLLQPDGTYWSIEDHFVALTPQVFVSTVAEQ